MNYILNCTREYNGEFQSVIVKLRGVSSGSYSGQRYLSMRSWAEKIADFDFTGITGGEFKSENLVVNESLRNSNSNSAFADVSAIIKWKKEESVVNDLPRNTTVRVKNTTNESIVSALKSKFTEITGTTYDNDNRLVITNLVIDLKPV